MESCVLEDYIKFPLVSEPNDVYVWTADRSLNILDWLLDCPNLTAEERKAILGKVNGETSEKFPEVFTHDQHWIYQGSRVIFRVRGWGKLTGRGGYGLSPETAEDLQDRFMEEFCRRANL